MKEEWFKAWFDSEYYHILYQQHNEQEARAFIGLLIAHLQPRAGARALDLACGKGRHSRFLAEAGLIVTGVDLSEISIRYARQFESERLSFFSHDMRKPFRVNYFDYIFNFFTSFGYFDTDEAHLETLKNIYAGLHPGGVFVLDYFNTPHVLAHLLPEEEITAGSTVFHIARRKEGNTIRKDIRFETPEGSLAFAEKVRLFTSAELEDLLTKAGLKIQERFGDYALNAFDASVSPRCILVCQKPLE